MGVSKLKRKDLSSQSNGGGLYIPPMTNKAEIAGR